MDSQRHELVRRRFLDATALEGEDRDRFLDRIAEEDPDLATRLRELLRQDVRTGKLDEPLVRLSLVLEEPTTGAAQRLPDADRFQILERIAIGGLAAVYRARQGGTEREVALKLLHLPDENSRAWRRFEVEARVLAALDHPGIAQVYEAGTLESELGPQAYIAMELVRGASLIDFVREAELPLERTVELFLAICQAVQHAHEAGVIHRDLKPENILVQADGTPRILDFGIAKVADPAILGRASATESGQLLGTLPYMSPERLHDADAAVDARVDVYSLGVLLFQALGGKLPFPVEGTSIGSAIQRILTTEPEPMDRQGRPLPEPLERVLLRAIEKDPERRYGSVRELSDDLERWLHGDAIAHPARRTVRLRRMGSRLVLSIAVVLSAIAAWSLSRHGADGGRFDLGRTPNSATLSRRNGGAEFSWNTNHPDGLIDAHLVDEPASIGGGQRIVLLFDPSAGLGEQDGRMCVFAASIPPVPLWNSGERPLHPPSGGELPPRGERVAQKAYVQDVIEEVPGSEILLVEALRPFSPQCLRVFDVEGNELFRAWHDGVITSLLWLGSQGLLLGCGLNSEGNWTGRGRPELGASYPAVLWALRPRIRDVSTAGWMVEGGVVRDDSVELYRWLGPPEVLRMPEDVSLRVLPPPPGIDPRVRSQLRVLMQCPRLPKSEGLWLTLDLDERLEVVGRFATESFRTAVALELLPLEEDFVLLPYEELPRPAGGQ